jgi:hypothetical protein
MDIYFAVLNFTLSGAIGLVGILTLQKVSTPNEVPFALLPLLFCLCFLPCISLMKVLYGLEWADI